jgi:hypothetical protein
MIELERKYSDTWEKVVGLVRQTCVTLPVKMNQHVAAVMRLRQLFQLSPQNFS